MECYTKEQRILIVKLFYQNGESFAATVRKLRSIWGHNNAPKESTVKRLIDKFAETGSVTDVKTTTRHRPGRSTENVAAVRDAVAQTPSTSIRHRAQQIGVSKSTLQRILTKDLHLHAYKVQLTQELKVGRDRGRSSAVAASAAKPKRKRKDSESEEEEASDGEEEEEMSDVATERSEEEDKSKRNKKPVTPAKNNKANNKTPPKSTGRPKKPKSQLGRGKRRM